MFTSTPDALVEVSAMLRVVKIEGGDNKALITKVHQGEQIFIMTPADCRHLAAVLLKDLVDEKPDSVVLHEEQNIVPHSE
jgi:hypothetical protein